MRRFHLLTMGLLIILLAACSTSPDDIIIHNSWVRPAPVDSNSAAYVQITNRGRADVHLVRVETTVTPLVQIHETVVDDNDMASMQQLESVTIPAGETVVFSPGGMHIMLMNLPEALTENSRVEMQLVFDNGATVVVDAPVRTEEPQD